MTFDRGARVPLAVLLGAAIAAFARSMTSSGYEGVIWILAIAALASPAIRLSVPPLVKRALGVLVVLASIATAVVSWSLMVVLMIHGESTEQTLLAIGVPLALVTVVHSFTRGREGMVGVGAAGLAVLAGLHRQAPIAPFLAIAGCAAASHVAIDAAVSVPRKTAAPINARRIIAAVFACGLAIALAAALPPAQRRMERAAWALYPATIKARSGLSADDVRLGEVESLARSERIVLRLWSPRGQKLRARVYLRFDGRIWHTGTFRAASTIAADAPLGPRLGALTDFPGELGMVPGSRPEELGGPEVIATRIFPIELDEGLLLSPGDALAVKSKAGVAVDPFGILVPPFRGAAEPYAVVHRRRLGVGDTATPESVAPGAPLRAASLALPRELDARLVVLANELARGAPTDREKVERTTAWVRTHAHYSLDVGRFHSRQPVAEFLFDKQRGYCEYFASAVAVLLRLQGVPARYVIGFQVTEANLEGEHYVVRDADAHAWAEALVDGVWLEADATPASEYAALHARHKSFLDAQLARLRAYWAELRVAWHEGRVTALAGRLVVPVVSVLSAVLIALVARHFLVTLRGREKKERAGKRTADLPRDVLETVAAIDGVFRALGSARPRSRGLLEHWSELVDAGALGGERADAVRRAIDVVHLAAFSGDTADAGALRASTLALEPLLR